MPEEKVYVIHYGIDCPSFMKPEQKPREVWAEDSVPLIGTAGRLEPRKGQDLLIRTMPLVLGRYPRARLLIAGHDPWGYGAELQGLIEGLGLRECVRLVGFQNDIPSFLHALDLFAFASRSEGFGLVLLEAMAASKPVVASRIAPLSEIVVDGETGILVRSEEPDAWAEAILWLLDHAEEAKKMGERGRERAKKAFSIGTMVEKTLRLYQQLAG